MDTMNTSTTQAPQSSVQIDTIGSIGAISVALVSESGPHSFRLARKPDGELLLQGAFVQTTGFTSKTIWRDLETVAWEPAA